MTTKDRLLTIREVADLLHVSILTIHRWTKSGFIGSVKLGKSRRYTQQQLDQFISRGERLGACGCIGISERAASEEQFKRLNQSEE